jgi:hypothetical protein
MDALAVPCEVATRNDLDPNRSRKHVSKLLDAEHVIWSRIVDDDGTHSEVAKLACALVDVQQQIRKEQMKPDPKQADVTILAERKAKLAIKDAQFSEPS